VGYVVYSYGWNEPFLVASVLCGIAALLYLKIDATKRVAISEQS
jgi:sugar phosphate permease